MKYLKLRIRQQLNHTYILYSYDYPDIVELYTSLSAAYNRAISIYRLMRLRNEIN